MVQRPNKDGDSQRRKADSLFEWNKFSRIPMQVLQKRKKTITSYIIMLCVVFYDMAENSYDANEFLIYV